MQVNVDYKFRDDLVTNQNETVPIELLLDPFAGLVYRYDKVTIKEETDHARMLFEYTLLDLRDFDEAKLRKDKTFNHTLGVILNAMILESVDADREANPQKPSEDGTVHT